MKDNILGCLTLITLVTGFVDVCIAVGIVNGTKNNELIHAAIASAAAFGVGLLVTWFAVLLACTFTDEK